MGVNNSCQVKSFGGGIMQSLFKSLSFLDIGIYHKKSTYATDCQLHNHNDYPDILFPGSPVFGRFELTQFVDHGPLIRYIEVAGIRNIFPIQVINNGFYSNAAITSRMMRISCLAR